MSVETLVLRNFLRAMFSRSWSIWNSSTQSLPGGLLSADYWVVPGYLVQGILGWLGPKHLHSGRLSGVLLAQGHICRYVAFSSAPFPLEFTSQEGGWCSFDETRNLGCQVIFFFRKLNYFSLSNRGHSLRIPAHPWVDLEKKGGLWLCLSLWCSLGS